MRKFLALLFVCAFVIAIGERGGYWNLREAVSRTAAQPIPAIASKNPGPHGSFIELADSDANHKLNWIRANHCSNYLQVLADVHYQYARRTEKQMQDAEWQLARQLAREAVRKTAASGTVAWECLFDAYDTEMMDDSVSGMLTPEGDVVFGYNQSGEEWWVGDAYTPLGDLRLQGMRLDRASIGGEHVAQDFVISPIGTRCIEWHEPEDDAWNDLWPECRDAHSPAFEDYGVRVPSDAKRAKLRLTQGMSFWNFRTRIREAYEGKPNFAGQYILTSWGCGGYCNMGVIIDTRTGVISDGPNDLLGWDFRRDSRLVRGVDRDGNARFAVWDEAAKSFK
jgi:hypothetical protein